jgi:predicted DNA-binding transcriptional regulator AlpA
MTGNHQQSQLITTAQAATIVRLSPNTLDKMRVTGRGPKYLKVGRRVFYRPEDLDAWLNSNAHSSTSEYGQKA